jgi:hypothetical protein
MTCVCCLRPLAASLISPFVQPIRTHHDVGSGECAALSPPTPDTQPPSSRPPPCLRHHPLVTHNPIRAWRVRVPAVVPLASFLQLGTAARAVALPRDACVFLVFLARWLGGSCPSIPRECSWQPCHRRSPPIVPFGTACCFRWVPATARSWSTLQALRQQRHH